MQSSVLNTGSYTGPSQGNHVLEEQLQLPSCLQIPNTNAKGDRGLSPRSNFANFIRFILCSTNAGLSS